MTLHTLSIFADYSHFLLQDEAAAIADGFDGTAWTDEAVARMLAAAPTVLAVGTARPMDVPVTIEIAGAEPDDDGACDLVTEASLDAPSGRLVCMGPTGYLPDAHRIELAPGTYGARVFYSGLATISADGLDGNDRYRIVLWPDAARAVRVVADRRPR